MIIFAHLSSLFALVMHHRTYRSGCEFLNSPVNQVQDLSHVQRIRGRNPSCAGRVGAHLIDEARANPKLWIAYTSSNIRQHLKLCSMSYEEVCSMAHMETINSTWTIKMKI
jgi:hypothetical protein